MLACSCSIHRFPAKGIGFCQLPTGRFTRTELISRSNGRSKVALQRNASTERLEPLQTCASYEGRSRNRFTRNTGFWLLLPSLKLRENLLRKGACSQGIAHRTRKCDDMMLSTALTVQVGVF